jgi:hypothetical protein
LQVLETGFLDNVTRKELWQSSFGHEWVSVMNSGSSYVLISRCRNEAAYLSQPLDPVIGQSDQRAINADDSGYFGKLDLDLRLPPGYFEIPIDQMMTNRRPADTEGIRADRTQALRAGMMA